MGVDKGNRRLADEVKRLVDRSIAQEIPTDVADSAGRASVRAFSARSWTERSRFQLESYFSAVVRRRLVRAHGGSRAVGRMMAAAVVADLTESGRAPSAVWSELERGWGDTIPADVLEEYRVRLCA